MEKAASICRDCFTRWTGPGRCPACRSPRVLAHPELDWLAIAHVDCDAFYASVEKRDNPELADVPVIVGGGTRGVVTTACYLARTRGVRSAMPMFQARRLCPEAVIVKPRMAHYAAVSRQIRAMMDALTPLVEPLSLDEAFLDLSGTERLHRARPVALLVRLQSRIERELGLSVSVGLSHNKFLAKIASDLDKPRGFAVIGRAESAAFLGRQNVGIIWGVGATMRRALESEGIRTIADLRLRDRKFLIRRFGATGDRLWHLARGEDQRPVTPGHATKSISSETTFPEDISDPERLDTYLWRLSEKVSARAKSKRVGGHVVILKLKHADHRVTTRRHRLEFPAQMADTLYRCGQRLLHCSIEGHAYRLIGLGISDLVGEDEADCDLDLLDPKAGQRIETERLIDQIRAKFGAAAITIGRSLH